MKSSRQRVLPALGATSRRPAILGGSVLALLTAFAFLGASTASARRSELTLSEDAEAIRQAVNIEGLKRDIARLTALPTRVTGYDDADSAAKYVFSRMQELGLHDVDSRTFAITVPIDAGTAKLVVRTPDGSVLRTVSIRAIWPNLVRVPFVPNGIKHHVDVGETIDSIAVQYRVTKEVIVEDARNDHLDNQRWDGLDNDNDGFVDDADLDGEITPVPGSSLFIPTGGLEGRLIYGGKSRLSEFDGKPVGGFWYEIAPEDTLESVARRFRVTPGSILDDVLNVHLSRGQDGVDNDSDGEIDEDGETEPFAVIASWGEDGVDNDGDGSVDETAELDRSKTVENAVFVPRGSIALVDFNSVTNWINAAMLGAQVILFIEPEETIRGQAENKFLTVPAHIPRFWIGREDAGELLSLLGDDGGASVELLGQVTSDVRWQKRVGQNIQGFLPGADPVLAEELVIVQSYYDSMSVVPTLAPGAETTAGIAAMLELVRLMTQPAFRPSRSVLFVATAGHFQGLAGMRAFMEGMSQDNVEAMAELRSDLNLDVIEFESLGRKIALSIDRGYLVEFAPTFFNHIDQVSDDLDSLLKGLADLRAVNGQIEDLAERRRAAKEAERKLRVADLSKNSDSQSFTGEERVRLEVNLGRARSLGLQIGQYLKDIVGRIDEIKRQALKEARETEAEIIADVGFPIAKIDVWATERIVAVLRAGDVGDDLPRNPESTLLPLYDRDGPSDEAAATMVSMTIPGYGEIDPIAAIRTLSRPNVLEDWEFQAKHVGHFSALYTPYRIMARHLSGRELYRLRSALGRLHGRDRTTAEYREIEQTLLDAAVVAATGFAGRADEIQLIEDGLSQRYRAMEDTLSRYLATEELTAARLLYDEMRSEQARELASQELSRYLNVAVRRLNGEVSRLTLLAAAARSGELTREFRMQEELALWNNLGSVKDFDRLMDARTRLFAEHERDTLTEVALRRSHNDVLELEQLSRSVGESVSAFSEADKRILRQNLPTMRNSRVRNIHKRIERLARIDTVDYLERIENIIQSMQAQQELGRYYQSLVVSLDLSTQGDEFGVFYKGWFYNDTRELELRREYAPIGNQLVEYASNASLKRNLADLRRFPDDHVRQAILSSQWEVADRVAKVEQLEDKTLETLVFDYFPTLVDLSGVSRLMKLQFEDMRQKGEPSETMLKDIDYIRKEVSRFVRNDIRETRRSRKATKRLFARVERMLTLKSMPVEDLSEDEISDLRALMEIAGIAEETNFVNAISATGGKTWQTYIPGKIAFDSEVATLAGKTGIAFATIDDGRVYTDTPLDTYSRLNFENLESQVETLASIMVQVLRDPQMPTSARVGNFYCTLTGRIVEYDARESAVPQTPVQNAMVAIRRQNKTMMGVRGDIYVLGDQKGKYSISGLAMEGRATARPGGKQEIEAFVLDPDSGDIVYAPDLGEFGAEIYDNEVAINRKRVGAPIAVFPCVSTTIYDLVDQRYLRTLTSLEVYDADRDAPPERYGLSRPWVQPMVSAAEPIALVYSEPDSRIKISMASGLLGKLLLLIKATATRVENPTLYTGEGFVVRENGSIRVTPYVVVKDMWNLDTARIALYRRYGISNDRLEELHAKADVLLRQAEAQLAGNLYSEALKNARAAWGNESIAYPDVKATGNDVVRGVMFYLFLLLPFSVFAERLLFAFTNINHRIGATGGVFLIVFLFLRQVHPAFEITETPFIILIAFIVLALTIVVITIIIRKFNEQLEKMRRERSKIYKADVGRLSASAAAFSLGISNMRKRRGRTALTCATLIVLTFTVISFTSVRTEIRAHSTRIPGVLPTYQGVLVRDQYWIALEEPVLSGIENMFRDTTVTLNLRSGPTEVALTNHIAPRAWYEAAGVGQQSSIMLRSLADSDLTFAVNMLVGMSPEERNITRIHSKLVYGRWFQHGDENAYVCVLPKGVADSLEITEEQVDNSVAKVRLLGAEFLVIGVLGIDFKELKDLDGEELTPVDYQLLQQQQQRGAQESSLEGELQKYQHLPPDQIAILPYQVVMDQGGNLKSIGVNMADRGEMPTSIAQNARTRIKIDAIMAPVMKRSALDFFVGKDRSVYLYSSIGGTATEHMSNLFIPILIAALIVLNTMLGAVYERVREIGIYSAVGLAPVHIAFLFIAEACVYAVLGAVIGYLLGQVTAWGLVQTGWLAGLTLNYSARSTVYATMIVMVVVLGSTLYPAIKAGRMAVPDIERKWRLPEPDGDEWHFDLPFTVLGEEALGMNIFMRDYFDAHADESASDFYVDDVSFHRDRTDEDGVENLAVNMMVWLAPYDLGVSQRVSLQTSRVGAEEEDLYRIHLTVYRESGEIASWKRVNRRFLNLIRKQLLIWRTFSVDVRGEFHARGREETHRLSAEATSGSTTT